VGEYREWVPLTRLAVSIKTWSVTFSLLVFSFVKSLLAWLFMVSIVSVFQNNRRERFEVGFIIVI
jgi:hypothetical protein